MPKTLTFLSAVLLLILFPVTIRGQEKEGVTKKVSVGGLFSPRHSGIDVSLYLDDGSFRDFAVYVDYSDILDRNAIKPGFRFTYYHNLPIHTADWNGFPFLVYAGPGVTLGYMHDRCETNYCFIGGVSGCIGIVFDMWHNVSIGVENQLDLSMKFGMNSDVSFFRTGTVFGYIPMVKIHYAF